MDSRQIELDTAERQVISFIFGDKYEENLAFRVLSGQVQQYINKFESFVRPLMSDDGTINGEELSKLIEKKNAELASYIPKRKFRISEITNFITGAMR